MNKKNIQDQLKKLSQMETQAIINEHISDIDHTKEQVGDK